MKTLAALLLGLFLAFGTPAQAATFNVPAAVSQGRAFPVTVADDRAFTIDFRWRGETLAVPARQKADGSWEASILLALPLDARGRQTLKTVLNGEERTFSITAKKVAWPQSVLSVPPRYVEPPASVREQIARDRQHSREALATRSERLWELPLARPVPGGITSPFGGRRVFNGTPRAPHMGTDLRSPEGSPVRAAADGIVLLAEPQYYGGSIVYLDHGQGVVSVYGHLSAFDVTPGERVQRGEVLGRSGSTGRVTGPHLHFGLMVQGVAVDAMPLLSYPPQTTGGPSRRLSDARPQKASR